MGGGLTDASYSTNALDNRTLGDKLVFDFADDIWDESVPAWLFKIQVGQVNSDSISNWNFADPFASIYQSFLLNYFQDNPNELYKFAFRLYPDLRVPDIYQQIYLLPLHGDSSDDINEVISGSMRTICMNGLNATFHIIINTLYEELGSDAANQSYGVWKLMPEMEDPNHPGFKEHDISILDPKFMAYFNGRNRAFNLLSRSISHLGLLKYDDWEGQYAGDLLFNAEEFYQLEEVQEFGKYPFFATDKIIDDKGTHYNILDNEGMGGAIYIFANCKKLKRLPANLFEGCQNCKSCNNLCENCTSLVEVPDNIFDPIKDTVETLSCAFENCSALKTIPAIQNMPHLQDVTAMCRNCTSLQGCNDCYIHDDRGNILSNAIHQDIFINCPQLYKFIDCFGECYSLQSTAVFGNSGLMPRGIHGDAYGDSSHDEWFASVNFGMMFYNCSSLKYIPTMWRSSGWYNDLPIDQHYDTFTGCTSANLYRTAIQHGWANS